MMLLSVLVGCAQAPAKGYTAAPAVVLPDYQPPEKKRIAPSGDSAVRRKQDELGRKIEDMLRQLNAPLKPTDDYP